MGAFSPKSVANWTCTKLRFDEDETDERYYKLWINSPDVSPPSELDAALNAFNDALSAAGSMATGIIVAIIVGAVCGVIICVLICVYACRKCKEPQHTAQTKIHVVK